MFNWFDSLMLLTVAVFAVIGFARGALGTVLSLAGGIVSMIISYVLGTNLAPWIYDNFIRPGVDEKITHTVSDAISSGVSNIGESIFNSFPSFLWEFCDSEEVVGSLNSITGSSIEELSGYACNIVHNAAAPVYIAVIRVCVIAVLFVILSIIIGILCSVSGLVNKIPIVGTANRIIGLVLGLVYGVMIVFIAVFAMSVFMPAIDKEGKVTESIQTNSFLFDSVSKGREKFYEAMYSYDTDEDDESYDENGKEYSYE